MFGMRMISQTEQVIRTPLSFVLGAKDRGQRVRQYEKRKNETIPIVAEMISWVVNHGPSNFSVVGVSTRGRDDTETTHA